MKKVLRVLSAMTVAGLFISFADLAVAAQHIGSGTVYGLVTWDSSWGANNDYFLLSGVTSLGTCPTDGGPYVALRLKDDEKGQRQYALVMAAKMSGATLTVMVDDTYVDPEGICYVRQVIAY